MADYNTYDEQLLQALSRLRIYCARQERCTEDVKQKLKKYELPYHLWDEAISYLIEEDYLNEERYAKAYVSGKFRMNQWGRYKIRQGLKMKKISEANIRLAMQEIDDESYRKTLKKLIRNKLERLRRDTDDHWEIRQKVLAYSTRKGYEIELVNDVLEEITSKD